MNASVTSAAVNRVGNAADMPAPQVLVVPPASRKEQRDALETNKLERRLYRLTGQAICDFNMIEAGDRVMVCLSGGKDSYTLLDLLLGLRARAPIAFDLIAVNVDQKQPGFPEQVLPDYLRQLGVPFHVEEQDTYSIVTQKVAPGKTLCSLCSRLRRGILYRLADELGASKIALGHHRDDILQTFFLNLFFGGKLKAMPPRLRSDDGRHVVIRPLAYVVEADIERWAKKRGFPIIPCNLCGSQEHLQRRQMREMLHEWQRRFPGRVPSIFRALQDVVPSHLLDRQRWDFSGNQPLAPSAHSNTTTPTTAATPTAEALRNWLAQEAFDPHAATDDEELGEAEAESVNSNAQAVPDHDAWQHDPAAVDPLSSASETQVLPLRFQARQARPANRHVRETSQK